MYQIHTSLGFIMSSKNIGESDKLLSVFTRENGLINILAHGVRYDKSKLRYHCQELTFSSLSFVKGREFYKLTGAESIFDGYHNNDERQKILSKITKIIKRLVHGELPLSRIFDDLYSIMDMNVDILKSESEIFESVIVFRILYDLGYIKVNNDHVDIVKMLLCEENILKYQDKRREINKFINQALKDSQL